MSMQRMGHPRGFGSVKGQSTLAESPSWRKTGETTASARARWPVEGLHPTLRDETAKDGAPVWFWRCEGEKGNRRIPFADDNRQVNGKRNGSGACRGSTGKASGPESCAMGTAEGAGTPRRKDR